MFRYKKESAWQGAGFVLVMAFTFPYIGKIIATYAGWNYAGCLLYDVSFYSLVVCFCLIGYSCLFYILRNKLLSNMEWVFCSLFIAFYLIGYLTWYFKYGTEAGVLRNIAIFVGVMLPSLFSGVAAGKNANGLDCFFEIMELCSILFFPMALVYIGEQFMNEGGKYIGLIGLSRVNYMTLALMYMPLLFAHIVGFVGGYKSRFVGISIKVVQTMRLFTIIAYCVLIILTGTRGVYLSVCLAGVILLLMNWYSRRNLIRCLVVMFTIISVLGVLTNSNRVAMAHRVRIVVEGLKQGDIVTYNYTRKLSWEDVAVLTEPDKSVHIEERILAERGNLYKLAVGEFVRRPFLGMGAGGFQVKYGKGYYPHNILLELLSETGIVGTLLYLMMGIYLWMKNQRNLLVSGQGKCLLAFFQCI